LRSWAEGGSRRIRSSRGKILLLLLVEKRGLKRQTGKRTTRSRIKEIDGASKMEDGRGGKLKKMTAGYGNLSSMKDKAGQEGNEEKERRVT